MWTTPSLKCPDDGDWLAVVRVTPDGETTLVRYLGDVPDDAEREIDALAQRWTLRATWPGDVEIQEGARVREFVKYPDEDPTQIAAAVARLRAWSEANPWADTNGLTDDEWLGIARAALASTVPS